MNRTLTTVFVILLLAVASATAGTKTFEIDPVHSSVTFEIRHLYSTFTGRFNAFSGTISGDLEKPDTLKVSAEVDVGSVDTANAARDKHLRAPEIFDVKAFPTAKFESVKTTIIAGKKGKVTGLFTLHGVTKELTFEGAFLGAGVDHRKGQRAGFTAKTAFNRTDFGVGYNLTLPTGLTVLGEEVTLIINLEAIEVEEPTPKSKETLADKIDAFKGGSGKAKPKEVVEALDRATAQIMAQGNVSGLRAGDKAPDFKLPDSDGKKVRLYSLLKKGPVVLVFYRGEWCPFCNLQLRALEETYPAIQKLGASLVAIAPQQEKNAANQQADNKLSFPLLSDTKGSTMRAYKLLYDVPDDLKKVFLERYKIDLEEYNGEGKWQLPVTATLIIRADGTVEDGLVDLDYTKQMEPEDIIRALEKLKSE